MNELDNVNVEEMGLSSGIAVITSEILFYKQQAGCAIIEIGRLLIEAKKQLKHGEWLPWLKEKVDFSERTAQNFMKCAEKYGENPNIVADLGAAKALALLALEPSEREEFAAEKHEVNGEEKSAAEMTLAELKQAIRERDEAKAEGEQTAARLEQAEREREKMAADMKFLNERLAGLNEEITEKERELKELRERPVEVAIQYQTDPTEIASARAEGEEAAKAEAEQAEQKAAKALDKLRQEKEKAEEEQKRLRAELEVSLHRSDEFQKDVERLRREAQQAGDKELAQFSLLFEQGQETVKRMQGILQRMDCSDRKETADKLRKALEALAEQIRAAAE